VLIEEIVSVDMALHSIAVVGASLAGLRAAQELRGQGFDGRLTLIGAEPCLPYDRPPLSKGFLSGKTDARDLALAESQAIESLEADWHLGVRAASLVCSDPCIRLDDGREIGADGVVIATGGSPRWLPGSRNVLGVHVLRSLSDAEKLRDHLRCGVDRVAVVGAGFIGAEVASTCSQMGPHVTLIEALEIPLGTVLGPTVGAVCAELHADHGVSLHTGVTVTDLVTADDGHGARRVTGVDLSDGRRLRTDLLVVGIGMRPEIQWLAGSGLVTDAGWVTRIPNVVAVGDVACRMDDRWRSPRREEHWTNAKDGPTIAVRNLLAGKTMETERKPGYFWSDQYGVRIQFAGLVAAGDEARIVEGSYADRSFTVTYHRNRVLTGVVAFNQKGQFAKLRKQLQSISPAMQ
jgi:NADPH-dependent 2,4-dienoyl-CoA reductase/sulfur reductase-like enzyme